MDYITIAILGKPFGLQGEVSLFLHTDFPELRFKKGRQYTLMDGKGNMTLVHLSSMRAHGGHYVAKFKEFSSLEEISPYAHFELTLPKEDAPLPDGSYRFGDLVGCTCVDEEMNLLGTVISYTDYAPTKNLKIEMTNKKCFYVPFLDQFVKEIDLEHKRIVIAVIEGMLP